MGTIEKRAVFNGLKCDIGKDLSRPPAIPAGALTFLGVGHLLCCGT